MPWDVQSADGIHLPQIGWHLDGKRPKARSFISHAHSDHLATHREVICTEATAKLMHTRMAARRIEHILPFGKPEQLDLETTVTLFPAGHILGSAQILIEHSVHGSLLYTGDFKLRQGRSAETCATPRADVLIMETTFGRPHYVMPPDEQVAADIIAFCRDTLAAGGTPVLLAYSLGKSQEALAILRDAGLPIMLHSATAKITRIYESLGQSFPRWDELNPAFAAGHVVICPAQSGQAPFIQALPSPRTATLTGWAIDSATKYRSRCDAAFALSDHADYNDLLRFVDLVRPKQVYTVHGFAQDFASTLRQRGVPALALGRDNQLEINLD